MTRKIINEAFFSTVLNPAEINFYVWLVYRGNEARWIQWPIERIAEELGISSRSIRRRLHRLASLGLINYRWPKVNIVRVDLQEITPEVRIKLKMRVGQIRDTSWVDEAFPVDKVVIEDDKSVIEDDNFVIHNKVEKEPLKGTSKNTPDGVRSRKTSDEVLSDPLVVQASARAQEAKHRDYVIKTPEEKQPEPKQNFNSWTLAQWAKAASTAFRNNGVTLAGYNNPRTIRPQIEVMLTALGTQNWPQEKIHDFLCRWLPENAGRLGTMLFRKEKSWVVSLGFITTRLPEVAEEYEKSVVRASKAPQKMKTFT